MGYDAGVVLIWGVRVDPELSEEIIWRLFGDQIREHAANTGWPLQEALEDFQNGTMFIPGTNYSYEIIKDGDYVTGIFISLKGTVHWVIRKPDETEYHIPPSPQEVETFLEVLSSYGIGVGGQGNLPVSQYGLWTTVVGG